MPDDRGVSSYRVDNGIAVLTIDSPPVNALSHAVRSALHEGVARALADGDARALVLICAGRTFFAGADVTEIGKPILPPLLADVMAAFESATKPIVSALHGTALGGGLELALAGHYRVAVPSAIVGLPEVALGLIPAAGGTQRVPRLVGVAAAVDMIGLGQHVDAPKALAIGLIDAIVEEGALEAQAIDFAHQRIADNAPLRRVRDLTPDLDLVAAHDIFAAFRARHPALFVGVKAASGVLEAIEASIALPFEEGLERERAISRALINSPESAAQRHLFFAERAATKLPGHEQDKAPAIDAAMLVGDWPHAARLEQRGMNVEVAGQAAQMVVVTLPSGEAERHAVMRGLSADIPIVLADASDSLDSLAAMSHDAGAVAGLSVTHGVAEVVVGAHTRAAAALAAAALARKLGWPSIFVAPHPGLVVERLVACLEATIAGLLTDDVPAGDIRATGIAFGLDARLLPSSPDEGVADDVLQRRMLYPVLREALALLDEGIAKRSSDIDFAMVRAGLWPLWQGGPAFLAERTGREAIREWADARGPVATLVD